MEMVGVKPFIDSIDSRNRLSSLPFAPAGRLIFSAAAEKMSSSKGPRPDLRRAGKSGAQGAFSFGYFSLGEQRKVTRKMIVISMLYKTVSSLIKLAG
jgi:hypothetical protein